MFNKVKLDISQFPVIEKVDYTQRLFEFNLPWTKLMSNDLFIHGANLICRNIIIWTRSF